MKKVLLMLLCGVMVLAAKFATADPRTDALGLTAGDQVDDLDSIWMFPQDAANYNNVVDLRLGNPNGNVGNDWGGVIEKDADDIGYIGVYTNRPFDESDGIAPNVNAASLHGGFNGGTNWSEAISPVASSYYGGYFLNSAGSFVSTHYTVFPYEEQAYLNAYTNFYFGADLPAAKVADPQNLADIFWAKDFTDVTLGVHLNYAAQRDGATEDFGDGPYLSGSATISQGTPVLGEEIQENANFDSSALGIDIGATLKNIGTNMSLGLGVGYSLGSVNYRFVGNTNDVTATSFTNAVSNTVSDDGINELRVNALLKDKLTDSDTARVYLNGRLDSVGFKDNEMLDTTGTGAFTNEGDVYNGTNIYTDTYLNLGLAFDHNVEQGKAHVIAGVGIIYDGRSWKETAYNNALGSTTANQIIEGSGTTYNEDWWVVPFNVAVEAPIFDWLTGRVGAQGDLYSNITAHVVYPYDANAANTAFTDTNTVIDDFAVNEPILLSYGATAKFNNFSMDLQLSPGALLNAISTLAPGAGLTYQNNSTTTPSTTGPSIANQIFSTFVQADMRYAF
jgi:hypothetical protein